MSHSLRNALPLLRKYSTRAPSILVSTSVPELRIFFGPSKTMRCSVARTNKLVLADGESGGVPCSPLQIRVSEISPTNSSTTGILWRILGFYGVTRRFCGEMAFPGVRDILGTSQHRKTWFWLYWHALFQKNGPSGKIRRTSFPGEKGGI
ncbi:hypothetical protein B0H12DRAFT_105791 [Mycena haematopus]|nr:hypothetical protein B0H12DRAFT_105791 [Mycena haematopus]